ncbi:hypothetical protein PF002_g28733 [Phytophthora fragariae]|uniref:Uncharacterized protein n=1 Tax=Phytophthora fragariae TaxID=53985 RepID=A0A6A3VY64_9STRA|nr:hypothetical protein PF003_g36802 [Phytophthora fragariae]KAE9066099.1 hypothetical protein PF007_g28605 [Phytophthora fragariae]KAE9074881.1 hypothetical protein PF006_g28452 [Phytophthora fragariae]KAE9172650.1 hypothetical protein PF004_g27208 [Phytophthora fragariae]KAE9175678.1 hypothetical protein PF002_g28733 [Phytophthora fragariae]
MGEADGGGSGNAPGLKETPIDDPYVVYRGPPDYTFCSLPYIQQRYSSAGDTYSTDYVFRMTSPYDVRQEMVAGDVNVGAGVMNVDTESDTGTVSARWFDYYAGMYKYYHVIGCKYDIFIENLKTDPLWAYLMFYNETQPPNEASNDDMQLWDNVKYKYIDRRAAAITSAGYMEGGEHAVNEVTNEGGTSTAIVDSYETSNHVKAGNYTAHFSGEYKPGQYRREIHLDSDVENWTLCTTNPSLPEKLLLRLKPVNDAMSHNNATNYGNDLFFKIRVRLSYLVEFKELKDRFRWPVQRQPLTVTIAQDVTSAN